MNHDLQVVFHRGGTPQRLTVYALSLWRLSRRDKAPSAAVSNAMARAKSQARGRVER
jgi:hypothetical protein